MIKNSQRFNDEVTILAAAYLLGRPGGASCDAAGIGHKVVSNAKQNKKVKRRPGPVMVSDTLCCTHSGNLNCPILSQGPDAEVVSVCRSD